MSIQISESMYIVKPEALGSRAEIRAIISQHLEVELFGVVHLTPPVLNSLYPSLPGPIREMTERVFAREVEIGVVRGQSAVSTLYELVGRETAPSLCAETSLRFRFGIWSPIMCGGGMLYYENAIHRPVDEREAAEHVACARVVLG